MEWSRNRGNRQVVDMDPKDVKDPKDPKVLAWIKMNSGQEDHQDDMWKTPNQGVLVKIPTSRG